MAVAGTRVKEWVFESVITYIKPVGGPEGREGLIVGCEDGTIVKVFIDNPFPVPLVKHKASVRCLDLSMHRDKLAVVDAHAAVSLYDVASGSLLAEEQNAESVAWNTEIPDMLCFSGALPPSRAVARRRPPSPSVARVPRNTRAHAALACAPPSPHPRFPHEDLARPPAGAGHGTLSIKTGSFPLHQQRMNGVVVGFKGSRIYALHYVALQSVDVPQSASLYRCVHAPAK